MTTFRGRCGCPLGTKGVGSSPACRNARGPVTWCAGILHGRRDADDDRMRLRWGAVEVGDLVRAQGGTWWEVIAHHLATQPDGTPVELVAVRTNGVVRWAKTNPTPQQHADGWGSLDPRAYVWVTLSRSHLRGTTDPLTPEQAAGRIAVWLGGVEIE